MRLLSSYSVAEPEFLLTRAVNTSEHVAIGLTNGDIHLLSVENGQCLRIVKDQGESAGSGTARGAVWSLALTKEKLFSGGTDRVGRVYSLEHEAVLCKLEGHTATVRSITIVDDNIIATGSGDGTIRIWNISSQTCLHLLEGHTKAVTSLIVIDNLLVSASYDGTVRSWDYRSGEYRTILRDQDSPIFSVATTLGGMVLAGCGNGIIRIGKMNTFSEITPLKGHTGVVNNLRVINGEKTLISGSVDGSVRAWSLTSLEPLWIFKLDRYVITALDATESGVVVIGGKDQVDTENVCGINSNIRIIRQGSKDDEAQSLQEVGYPWNAVMHVSICGNKVIGAGVKRGRATVEVWEL